MGNTFPDFPNTNTCTIDFFSEMIAVLPPGDILEFGVASCQTTISMASKNPERRLFAFDHFKGLEQTQKYIPGYAGWHEGAFRVGDPDYPHIPSSIEEVMERIKPYPNILLNVEDVHLLKEPSFYNIGEVVAVNVDVDIYEPTVSCLNFLDKCSWSKLYIRFDDWHGHEPDFDNHERLACKEWFERNPHYSYSIPQNGHAGGVIVWR